jgi:hypothetical protein
MPVPFFMLMPFMPVTFYSLGQNTATLGRRIFYRDTWFRVIAEAGTGQEWEKGQEKGDRHLFRFEICLDLPS